MNQIAWNETSVLVDFYVAKIKWVCKTNWSYGFPEWLLLFWRVCQCIYEWVEHEKNKKASLVTFLIFLFKRWGESQFRAIMLSLVHKVSIKQKAVKEFCFGHIILVCNMKVSDYKLDGVAPLMTDPPPISYTTLSKKKNKNKWDTWHVKCDTWHVTRDMWHVTRDMWHMTRLGGWTFSQNFSSLALTVCDLWYYEDILGKGWIN